jgi:hypothetical protein
MCAALQVGELRAHVVGRERETKLIRATLADVDAEVHCSAQCYLHYYCYCYCCSCCIDSIAMLCVYLFCTNHRFILCAECSVHALDVVCMLEKTNRQ